VLFQDLNNHLSNKTYFIGLKLSLADVMLYYALHSLLSDMMPQEREMYINVSRWFHQVNLYMGGRTGRPGGGTCPPPQKHLLAGKETSMKIVPPPPPENFVFHLHCDNFKMSIFLYLSVI